MKILAIDSAFEACSVALWLDGALEERFHAGPRGHAEHLLPFVEELLAEAAIPLNALDTLAFSRGPGSFTSLRIGIGVVQGLAWGSALPVWPVSSLRVVAQGLVTPGGAPDGMPLDRIRVAMDARMDEVFVGSFRCVDGLMQPLDAEWVGPPAMAVPPAAERWLGAGNGFERFEALCALPLVGCFPQAVARASVLATIAASEWNPTQALRAEDAQPVYLRDRVAEKSQPAKP